MHLFQVLMFQGDSESVHHKHRLEWHESREPAGSNTLQLRPLSVAAVPFRDELHPQRMRLLRPRLSANLDNVAADMLLDFCIPQCTPCKFLSRSTFKLRPDSQGFHTRLDIMQPVLTPAACSENFSVRRRRRAGAP